MGEMNERFFFCEYSGDNKQPGGEFEGGQWTVLFDMWGKLTEASSERQNESGDLKNVIQYSLKVPKIEDAVNRYGSNGAFWH